MIPYQTRRLITMGKRISRAIRRWSTGLVAGMLLMAGTAPAFADSPDRYYRDDYRDYRGDRSYGKHYKAPTIRSRGKVFVPPGHRQRWYRDVLVVRPYGYWYPGYGYYDHDDDAYKWLSFTAIALKLLDNLNEQQQREHEAAQIAATTAPIGETIIWREGGASGAVTATREGTTTSGRYCREFLQEVTIGGRKEQAYGTACRQPDGAWEVISVDRP
jgi:hypothetical protein